MDDPDIAGTLTEEGWVYTVIEKPRTRHGRYVLTTSRLHNWPAFDVNDILAIEAEAAAGRGDGAAAGIAARSACADADAVSHPLRRLPQPPRRGWRGDVTGKSMEYTQRRCPVCGSTRWVIKGERSTRCPYRTIHERALWGKKP